MIEGFDEISEDTKSAVISAVLAAVYNCLVHQINMILENLKSQCEFAVYKPPDVINTTMNSLIQSVAMLDRIAMNKGVDANVALRDKLKVYAAEKD